MNVIYLAQVFDVGQDAGTDRPFYFCRYLARHGHKVTAITSNVDYRKTVVKYPREGWRVHRQIQGVDIYYVYSFASFRGSLELRLWYYLTYLLPALVVGMSVKEADVIYASSVPLTVALLGYVLSRLKGVPFVFEVGDIWPDALVAVGALRNRAMIRLMHALEMFCYRKAAYVVALTQGIRDNIVAKGTSAEKVIVITNGVDPTLFQQNAATDTECVRLRQELGFDSSFVCMYLGAHGSYNALWTVIELADALRTNSRYLCVLVGDGDEKPRLQKMTQERGLTNVRFLTTVARETAPSLLRTADVFLLPNRRGDFYAMNLPNKLFDFLAAGRPIVVAGQGESANAVQAAGAGRVVPAEDGAAMAAAIVELAALSGAERAAMGELGRRYVLREYSRESLSQGFAHVLERAVQSTRSGR
jgi:glycosyltransferase involved in cell wall biosynthesis